MRNIENIYLREGAVRKREKNIEDGVREYNKRATKVGDAREIGLRVLAKSSAIISARVPPPAYASARNEYART